MLIKHSALYLAGRIIPGVLGILALGIYTRLLSVEEYGQYAIILATMGLVNVAFFHWLCLSTGRFLPTCQDKPQRLLSTLLAIYLFLVLSTGLIGVIASWFWPVPVIRDFIPYIAILSWAQGWFELNLKLINTRLAPIRYGFISALKAVLALGLGLVMIRLGVGFLGILLGLALALLISTFPAWRQWRGVSFSLAERSSLRQILAYGLPLSLTLTLTIVVDFSDRFLLGWLKGSAAVGSYAAAYDLSMLSLGALIGAMSLAAFPLAVRALEDRGLEAARRQIQQNLKILLMVALPATAGLVMLSDNFAASLLGGAFHDKASRIIAWVAPAILIGGLKSSYLDLSFQLGIKTRGQVLTVLVAAVINIGLNMLWIPYYGTKGAAYATFAAFSAGLVTSWVLGRKAFPLPPPPGESYKIIIAVLAMLAALWPTLAFRGVPLLLTQVLIGTLVYFAILCWLDISEVRLKMVRIWGLFLYKISKDTSNG